MDSATIPEQESEQEQSEQQNSRTVEIGDGIIIARCSIIMCIYKIIFMLMSFKLIDLIFFLSVIGSFLNI